MIRQGRKVTCPLDQADWQSAALSNVPPKLLKNGRGILRAVWRPINNRPQDGIPPHIGHTFIPTPVRPAHITNRTTKTDRLSHVAAVRPRTSTMPLLVW